MTNICPHCKRPMKLQKQSLTRGILVSLIQIYNSKKEVVHFQKLFNRDNSKMCNAQKLKYFGLIENVKSGHWKLTSKGIGFVQNRISCPRDLYVFNNEVVEIPDQKYKLITELLDKETYAEYYREREDYRADSKDYNPSNSIQAGLFNV